MIAPSHFSDIIAPMQEPFIDISFFNQMRPSSSTPQSNNVLKVQSSLINSKVTVITEMFLLYLYLVEKSLWSSDSAVIFGYRSSLAKIE